MERIAGTGNSNSLLRSCQTSTPNAHPIITKVIVYAAHRQHPMSCKISSPLIHLPHNGMVTNASAINRRPAPPKRANRCFSVSLDGAHAAYSAGLRFTSTISRAVHQTKSVPSKSRVIVAIHRMIFQNNIMGYSPFILCPQLPQ